MKLTKTKSGRSHRIHGRDAQIEDDFPVIITSYDIAMRDSVHLSNFTWKYLVVDEGHQVEEQGLSAHEGVETASFAAASPFNWNAIAKQFV